MSNSRTKNVVLNLASGIFSYLAILVATFYMRRVFDATLGSECWGVNTFYNSVINILSISELGIGTAILFFLYKPFADGDRERVRSYMQWYAKAYRVIAAGIFAFGLALFFFVDRLVNAPSFTPWSLRWYFLLFVVNSSVSYLMAYKRNILHAAQNSRAISNTHTVAKLAMTLLQVGVLFWTGNYAAFLSLYVACSVAENVFITIYVNRKYPYLRRERVSTVVPLTEEERKEIWRRIRPLIFQNLAWLVIDYTDTLIITMCLGAETLAFYSNYTMITTTLGTLFGQVFAAFTVSFGNLAAEESKERCRTVYERMRFLAFWLAASWSACYLALVQIFIGDYWLNADNRLELLVPVLITVSYYMSCFISPGKAAQNALGLHSEDQWAMLAYAVANIVLSIGFVYLLGVAGVVLGTAVSRIIPIVSKERVMYRKFFGGSPAKAYLEIAVFAVIAAGIAVLNYFLINVWMKGAGFGWFVLQCGVAFVLPNVLLALLTFWTDDFKYYAGLLARVFRRRKPPTDPPPSDGGDSEAEEATQC